MVRFRRGAILLAIGAVVAGLGVGAVFLIADDESTGPFSTAEVLTAFAKAGERLKPAKPHTCAEAAENSRSQQRAGCVDYYINPNNEPLPTAWLAPRTTSFQYNVVLYRTAKAARRVYEDSAQGEIVFHVQLDYLVKENVIVMLRRSTLSRSAIARALANLRA